MSDSHACGVEDYALRLQFHQVLVSWIIATPSSAALKFALPGAQLRIWWWEAEQLLSGKIRATMETARD